MNTGVRQDYALIASQLGVTSNPLLAAALIDRIGIGNESVVVDLGCGAAGDARLIALTTGARVFGIDSSVVMLALARPPVAAVLADVKTTPIQTSSADAVYSINLMQLLADRSVLFDEAARILRPGGVLALLITNRRQLRSRFINRFFPGLREVEQSRYPTVALLQRELTKAGFSRIRCHPVDLGSFSVDTAYLHRQRTGIVSGLSLLPDDVRDEGLNRLEKFIQERNPRIRWIRTLAIVRKRAD